MRVKFALLFAFVSSGLLIGGAFALQSIMFAAAESWVRDAIEIPLWQRALYSFAVFWSHFWWLSVPLIIIFCAFIGFAAVLVRDPNRT